MRCMIPDWTRKISAIACIALAAAAALSGCAEKELAEASAGEGTGNLKLQVSLPQTKASGEYDALKYSIVRIYSITRGAGGEVTGDLVRRYKPASSVPDNLYLAAGEYKITVEAGKGTEATFTEKTYYGESTVTLEANKDKTVTVECKVTNVVVKVVFDETVKAAFDEGFRTYVSAAGEFDRTAAEDGTVPALEYTSDATGFFILPEGVTNLSWGFYGDSSDEAIDAKGESTGVIESPGPGVQYTLTYKYSKDADGFLNMSVQVREYDEVLDDSFVFSPQPTIAGDGFSFDETVAFSGEDISLDIGGVNPLSEISFRTGETTYTVMTGGQPSGTWTGIELSRTDEYNAVLNLKPDFVSSLAAGIHTLDFVVRDNGGGETSATMKVAVKGTVGLSSVDLWMCSGKLSGVVTDPAVSGVKFLYRVAQNAEGAEPEWGEWTEVPATLQESYLYTAEIEVNAGKKYEMQMSDGVSGDYGIVSAVTEAGVQMPNAGFEEWHQDGDPWYPYAADGTPFWGTGNPGATTLGASYNLTTYDESDKRPGTSGNRSARLETKKPNIVGIGKLAAGNIFVGEFGEVDGMGGTVHMGRKFEFNARPKALRVWYKYTPKGTDKGRIYVCLVNMTNGASYHVVNTNSPDATTFLPDDEFLYTDKNDVSTLEGHIIGYGDLMLETSVTEWTMVEIPITYRDAYMSEKSNVLMVTASASWRGDYFEGEVGSLMYLDDVEFVY